MKNDGRKREVLGLGVFFVVSGCATIAGLDQDYQQAPVCEPTLPPSAPSVKDVAGDNEVVLAIKRVDLDEEDEIPRFGYDVDGKCSCTIDEQSCAKPEWLDSKKFVCDDEHGVDNGAGIALARINLIAGGAVTSSLLNEGVLDGLWSLLVRIRGYSGTPDDDKVSVVVYETPGTMTPPVWDGSTTWPVSNTSVAAGSMNVDDAVFLDNAAYVRGSVLVAHLPEIRLLFRALTVRLPITIFQTTLTAKIVDLGGGQFHLSEGTISGIWRQPDMFKAMSGFRYGDNGTDKLCTNNLTYLQVRNLFCSVTDLYDPNSTQTGMGGGNAAMPECNAVSFGMRFDADPVVLGAVMDPPPPPMDACPVGSDPTDDACR